MQSFDPGLRSGQPVRSSNVSKSDPGPISVKPSFLKSVSVGLNALANKMMDGATSLMRSSSKMAPETTKGDPKVTSTKEGLKALSEEVSKGEVSFDEFKSKVQDMSDQIDRLDQSGTASKPELKELRVELNRVVKNTMKELKQIVGNPDQSVNDFFETYEAVQHSREFCAAKYMGANDKFTSVSGSFFDGNEAPPTMSDNKSVNREKTQLLREAAYGMVTERSLPVSSNKGGERLLPDQFVALGDQLVDSGMAHRLPDGQLKLNATISNSDIDGFVPDFDSGGLQFVTEGDQKGVVQSVRQSLHELKDHRIVAIALKSNPGSAKVFLPKLDEAAVREKKIELKLHPEYSRATDDQLTEIAEKEVLKESSSLVRTLTEAIEMPHRKGAESAFGDSFSIPKPLESSAKALSKHATLHQAFNVEEGLLRGAHTDILSQRDDLNASSKS